MASHLETIDPTWPDGLTDVLAVTQWISETLPGNPTVSGPSRIYQVKKWGIVAQFDLRISSNVESVVFKASHLSMFTYCPLVDAMLWRRCPKHVPEILAYETWADRAWYLYRPFTARLVSSICGGGPIEEIARAFAEIQGIVAAQPESELVSIPRVPLDGLPERVEELRCASEEFEFPSELHDLPELLAMWTDELVDMAWPDSIDHVDLQRDNAAATEDGAVLIFDWEEAVLGCPFFSIHRLLWDAEEFGRRDQVLQAYLEGLPWGSSGDRRRALDLARCLSPVQREVERAAYRVAQNWPKINPFDKLRPNLGIWRNTR